MPRVTPAKPVVRHPKREPSLPGGLMREIIAAIGLGMVEAARGMKISRPTLNDVLRGRRPLTAEVAVRFEKLTGAPVEALYRMQAEYDLWEARQRLAGELAKIKSARPKDGVA